MHSYLFNIESLAFGLQLRIISLWIDLQNKNANQHFKEHKGIYSDVSSRLCDGQKPNNAQLTMAEDQGEQHILTFEMPEQLSKIMSDYFSFD